MEKSIVIKLLVCSMFIIIISTSFCMSSSYAIGEIFESGKSFLHHGNDITETINTSKLEETSDFIYNGLLGIAVMVAIIVAMVLGIQFMTASADEKAKVKEAMMPFVVGCFVVFGSFTIWKVAVNIGNDAEDKNISDYDVVAEVPYDSVDIQSCSSSELLGYYSDYVSLGQADIRKEDTRFGDICYEVLVNRRIYIENWIGCTREKEIRDFYRSDPYSFLGLDKSKLNTEKGVKDAKDKLKDYFSKSYPHVKQTNYWVYWDMYQSAVKNGNKVDTDLILLYEAAEECLDEFRKSGYENGYAYAEMLNKLPPFSYDYIDNTDQLYELYNYKHSL